MSVPQTIRLLALAGPAEPLDGFAAALRGGACKAIGFGTSNYKKRFWDIKTPPLPWAIFGAATLRVGAGGGVAAAQWGMAGMAPWGEAVEAVEELAPGSGSGDTYFDPQHVIDTQTCHPTCHNRS